MRLRDTRGATNPVGSSSSSCVVAQLQSNWVKSHWPTSATQVSI
ncbi:DUF3678 domain-containing protein [Vibrio sp. V38_P2S17PM301]|nr:DUF3678 domain-containing protein [Vibrio sp. V36_P2S2PM302]NAX25698.1 DUF3678 domain-containing protein [Vibrio sp. V38_P2S17PM301]NAX31718.1 DUF3678 domain-containing protein [Vibrio sp. V37_P2S8PM304]